MAPKDRVLQYKGFGVTVRCRETLSGIPAGKIFTASYLITALEGGDWCDLLDATFHTADTAIAYAITHAKRSLDDRSGH